MYQVGGRRVCDLDWSRQASASLCMTCVPSTLHKVNRGVGGVAQHVGHNVTIILSLVCVKYVMEVMHHLISVTECGFQVDSVN